MRSLQLRIMILSLLAFMWADGANFILYVYKCTQTHGCFLIHIGVILVQFCCVDQHLVWTACDELHMDMIIMMIQNRLE